MNKYYNISSTTMLEIILQENKQSDEAMYYLLRDRLYNRLEEKYNSVNGFQIVEFADVLDDFFLYLREGKGNTKRPYSILHTIRRKDAFESWIISTFRNFLNNQIAKKKHGIAYRENVMSSNDNNPLEKEELIHNASILIAYSHQVLSPRNQFLLLRTLLTLLNKENALPDKEMAEAMGMSHVLYRVTTHRIMQSVKKHQMNMESGMKPLLDDYHKSMAENINSDFDTLYSTLIKYYNTTLNSLENASAIINLRKSHYESAGFMLHEDIVPYGSLSIYGFFNKLNSSINQRFAA